MPESLFELLEQSARRHAQRPAVSFQGRSMSYAELHAASGRVAGLLQAHGMGPGDRIGFSFFKSIDALTALFAVIRTGATYVPLDPHWPVERIHMICEDAGIHVWLGSKPPLIPGMSLAVVSAKTGESDSVISFQEASRQAAGSCEVQAPAEGIANVLYTSGSTGRPKGVQITTESLLHFSRWVEQHFELTADDRVANHAPYQFDLSTLDIFAAVRAGATMCPVPEGTKMLPYQLAKFLGTERISIWYSVPSALAALLPHLGQQDLRALRQVIFAGEVMPIPVLRCLAEAVPGAVLTNLYGPTETNVCTVHQVEPEDLIRDDALPIGRPIAATRVWIMNGDGDSSACEQAEGELWVAGPTLTTGYLGDSQLTRERLVPAPDGIGDAYRTKDRVSRRADGVLLFHGRMDRMLKLQGYRIEPGEIEAAISSHPRIRAAAVLAVVDQEEGAQKLKAFVVVDGTALDRSELTAHCRLRLPGYMVPELWDFLDELPRTDRGKIDYGALARLNETPPRA